MNASDEASNEADITLCIEIQIVLTFIWVPSNYRMALQTLMSQANPEGIFSLGHIRHVGLSKTEQEPSRSLSLETSHLWNIDYAVNWRPPCDELHNYGMTTS